LIIPFVVGFAFISDKNKSANRLKKLAGWFIFKPIITTPIWMIVIFYSNYLFLSKPSIFWSTISILPAVTASIIIVYKFQDLFRSKNLGPWILLGFDIVRWGSTYVAMNIPFYKSDLVTLAELLSASFPTLYTIIAIILLSSQKSLED
jgi:hypothetical protein